MTPEQRKTMRMALEALERSVATCFDQYAHEQVMSRPEHFVNQAITALRQALEQQDGDCQQCGGKGCVACDARKQQPADEPVAWMDEDETCIFFDKDRPNPMDYSFWKRLYRVPQPAAWVSLTDEELEPLCDEWRIVFGSWTYDFARAIEAALRSKNT